MRGGPDEVETIKEDSEIILAVVQNGCETLLNNDLRKLADPLIKAEQWDLALSVHLKFGLPTSAVMAAHGLSCLRVGCFDTGKFAKKLFY